MVKQNYNNEFHALLRIAELLDEIKDNLESMKDNSDDITEMMEWSEEQFQNINSVQAGVWTTVFTIANWDIYELKGAYLDIRNLPANQTMQIRIEVDDGGGWSHDCYYGETITVTEGVSPQVIPLADMTFGVAMRIQVNPSAIIDTLYYGYVLVERS
jgi:hypothetical protein